MYASAYLKYFIPVLLITAPGTLAAQDTVKRKSAGNYVNMGISLGYGGPHAYGLIPAATLKIWRIGLSGSYLRTGDGDSYGLGIEADIYTLPSAGKYHNYLGLSTGLLSNYRNTYREMIIRDMYYALGGYSMNRKEGRQRITIKAGLAYCIETSFYPSNQQSKILPYAELSYSLYVLPFREETFKRQNRIKQNKGDSASGFKDFLRRYFNPGIVFGVGGIHPFAFLPHPTLRSGIFTFELSAFVFEAASGGIQVKADIIRLPRSEKYFRNITASAGIVAVEDLGLFYFLAGYHKRRAGGTRTFDFKVGLAKVNDDSSPWDIVPYGQLSLGLHFLSFPK